MSDESHRGPAIAVFLESTGYTVARGSEVEIPLVIQNPGEGADFFEISVVNLPQGWYTLPTPPSFRLEHQETVTVRLKVHPPGFVPGQTGTFPLKLRAIRQSQPGQYREIEITLTITQPRESSKVQVEIPQTDYVMAPGSDSAIPLTIRNLGNQAGEFRVAFKGIPEEWVRLDQLSYTIEAGKSQQVFLRIRIPPASEISAGQHTVNLLVSDPSSPSTRAEAYFHLTIAAFLVEGRVGVMMESVNFSVSPGATTQMPVLLTNQGSDNDTFRVTLEGLPPNWISSPVTNVRLAPGAEREVILVLRPPRTPHSRAGRHAFKLLVSSQVKPSEIAQVDCVLTITAFVDFKCELTPPQIGAGETAYVNITNQGNIQQNFTLVWSSESGALNFQIESPKVRLRPGEPLTVRIAPGSAGTVAFRVSPNQQILLGEGMTFQYKVEVISSEKKSHTLGGQLSVRGLIPAWFISIFLVACLGVFCVSAFWIGSNQRRIAATTQTAVAAATQILAATQTSAAQQTAVAIYEVSDNDGDGLTNQQELIYGTNPDVADTDGDGLSDSDEISRGTNPLNPDTDGDLVTDGDEVLVWKTNPLNPDTDEDGLRDGDEMARGTDPLNPDTDGDQLGDGAEIAIGTNPLLPDTDQDHLTDGVEAQGCTDPLNPDTDGDGILDGNDLDPCDANNPSYTATAAARQPTQTAIPASPTPGPSPTGVTQTPINPTITNTPSFLFLPGSIAFTSNRDGNDEIYVLRSPLNATPERLTSDPAADYQPAWSPRRDYIAFTSDRGGNKEIYLMNANGSNITNLTNNPADDQNPAWSQDGQWIAFTSNRDGNQEIYIMRSDGSSLRNLTNNPANDASPAWGRSGFLLFQRDVIVFTSDRDGNLEIYRMNADGTGQTNMTRNPANDFSPSWSPVVESVAFVSDRTGNYDIFTMNNDGSEQANLTNNPSADLYPTWSTDGVWLAFTTDRDGNQEIYIVEANGTNLRNLTMNPAADLYPNWR